MRIKLFFWDIYKKHRGGWFAVKRKGYGAKQFAQDLVPPAAAAIVKALLVVLR